MVGFVWSGLCIFLLLSMVLRLLSLLLTACESFGLLFTGSCGLVVSLQLVLVPYLASWMGPLGVALLFVWSGFGFVCFAGIWLFGLRRLVGFIVFLKWLVRVALVVLFIFFLLVLLRLVLGGILMLWLGLGLVCLCIAIWLALFSISRLLFLMLGGTRLLLTFVVGKVFGVGLCWMSLAPCSS